IKEVITPARAMKRLAQEGYRAARCAIREGQQETACQLLKQSYQRHLNFKTLLWWLIAISNHNVKKLQEKLHVF
ncbi:MAG: hypothetical protein ACYSYU_06680, partial [Planctomycetota bacterium]